MGRVVKNTHVTGNEKWRWDTRTKEDDDDDARDEDRTRKVEEEEEGAHEHKVPHTYRQVDVCLDEGYDLGSALLGGDHEHVLGISEYGVIEEYEEEHGTEGYQLLPLRRRGDLRFELYMCFCRCVRFSFSFVR